MAAEPPPPSEADPDHAERAGRESATAGGMLGTGGTIAGGTPERQDREAAPTGVWGRLRRLLGR